MLNLFVQMSLAAAVFLGVVAGAEPLRQWILKQERTYGYILRTSLLLDINPRSATYFGIGCVLFGALVGYLVVNNMIVAIIGGTLGGILPMITLRMLRRRRMGKLEDQLVDGVQSLASGVRAGLNLVQAFELVAHNLPAPIGQEFAHMIREYEYGTSLDRAMMNAAERIGSINYRLVFSALLTHRERGGDLGDTLDRIAESVREIQRLEKRVETLTAQGRAAARWMGMMPAVILGILWFIDKQGVELLFSDDIGKILLAVIVALNLAGFLWIRQIVNIDI
jgi:tight adherence protein B